MKACMLMAALLGGCVSSTDAMRDRSTGLVPCERDAIGISNYDSGMSGFRWVATCNGRRYQCAATGGMGTAFQNSCAELKGQAATP